MKKGGGHSKGAAWEREVAKRIAKAFKPFGVVQRDCWRSVLSGGHEMSCGDLVMSEKLLRLFPFAVECKFHRKIDWWHFLIPVKQRSKSWKEWQWMEQAVEGAKKGNTPMVLKPLLVMKENRGPTIVCLNPAALSGYVFQEFDQFLKQAVSEVEDDLRVTHGSGRRR